MFKKLKEYLLQVFEEFKKIKYPERKEVVAMAISVLVAVLVVGLFCLFVDWIFVSFINWSILD